MIRRGFFLGIPALLPVLLVGTGTIAHADAGPWPPGVGSLSAGTRVRVTATAPTLVTKRTVGWIEEWNADSLVFLRDPDRGRAALPTVSVKKLETINGVKGYPVEGAVLGLLVGTAAGVFVGAVAAGDGDGSDERFAVAALTTLTAFTVVGAVLGNNHKTERWKQVYER
jgi:hypothetical protein